MTACDRVDLAAGVLVFESPKSAVPRSFGVPVPPALLDTPTWCTAFAICPPGAASAVACGSGLSPMIGRRAVHAAMQAAGLAGAPPSAKRLRLGFGAFCQQSRQTYRNEQFE